MPKKKLTDQFLRNLSAPQKEIEYSDHVVSGLVARVTTSGTVSFSFRYFLNGRGKRLTIGKYPEIRLAEARKQAKKHFLRVQLGEDPQRKKRQREEDLTVRDLIRLYKKKHLPKLKESTRDDYGERIKNVIIPALGDIKANTLDEDDILDLLEYLADERGSPIQSNRVRAILSSIYTFGQKYRVVRRNPVKAVHRLGEENQRERYYSDKEIKKIWELADLYGFPTGSLIKMLLMTGQRLGETRQMKWEYIKKGVWYIPEELTKANRKHELPLPDIALDMLSEIQKMKLGPFVFQSPYKKDAPILWVQWIAKEIRDAGVGGFRIHDIRRTVATNMSALGVNRTTLGKVLNHKALAGDDHVTARYDRYDYMKEKGEAVRLWAGRLDEILREAN